MRTMQLSADGQAIALACSSLALATRGNLKPLQPKEWHSLTLAMREADLRPGDLLGREAASLRSALGIAPSMAERLADLLSRGGQLAFELERLANRGIWVLTRADDSYPSLLKKRLRSSAPPLLFGAGSQSSLECPALAVVGSRDVDPDGLAFAEALGRRCGRERIAVVSGAARGVDAAAIKGALEAGGTSIGITVDPLERLVRRQDFRAPIEEGVLTLATPYHPSARWHTGNAMRRNRLIYAIAHAAVVVAASAEGGGTRAGALENLKARWVPLWVRDDGSAGNRKLLHDGGRLLPEEAIEDLNLDTLFASTDVPSLVDDSGEHHVKATQWRAQTLQRIGRLQASKSRTNQ
jgi:predicted Rossmann fold nucleotide-binding protein DprA/Smf involved in DNA uptake